jgi:hypothetical protein
MQASLASPSERSGGTVARGTRDCAGTAFCFSPTLSTLTATVTCSLLTCLFPTLTTHNHPQLHVPMDRHHNLGAGTTAGDGGSDDGWATDSSGEGGVSDDADFTLPGFLQGGDGVYYPIEDDLGDSREVTWRDIPYPEIPVDAAGMQYAAELLGLPGRLAQRQRDAERLRAGTRAESLRDSFMADGFTFQPSEDPSTSHEAEAPFILPPENAGRVALEFTTVVHMLSTSALWLESVVPSTISPDDQERLFDLAGWVTEAVLRLPRARQELDVRYPLSPAARAAGGGSTLGNAAPLAGPATLNEAPLSSTRPRRPQRRPRRL